MIEFWWSSGNNKRKIAWVAWEKLCKDKELGGLGFHDIEKFNQSLLAKQAWRIFKKPESLIARILKSKYFPRVGFLDGNIGRRPSYAWRSILHGRELLKQGLIKEIGNGEDTRVWLDNWIVETIPRPPNYHQDALVDLTLSVRDLIDQDTGGWNVRLIRQIIAEEDVERVLQIKPNRSRVDSLKWCFSNNGIYNSKSGYKLLQELHELHAPATNSMPPLEKRLWSSLWKAKASPKLRHFLWRVLSGALAVKQQLHYRGIQVDPLCSVCGTEAESICHMLFHYPRAREVWSLSQLPLPVAGFSQNFVFLNLHYLFTCSRNERISPAIRLSFPWILWHIWKARNMLSFEQVRFSAVEIWNKASEEASVWHELHNVEVPAHTTQPIAPGRQQSWVKPPCDLVKCNIGCSWSARTSAVGSSWIIRDTRGNVLCHSRRRFTKIFSEAQAAMETFEWAVEAMLDLKFQRVILEFSNRVLHNIFNQGFLVLEFGAWLQKIHKSFLSFEISKISWVPVGCNSIALEISDSVIRDQRVQYYVAYQGPSWLHDRILSEASLST